MKPVISNDPRMESRTGLPALRLRSNTTVLIASITLSLITAQMCHGYLSGNLPQLPELVYGAVCWLWWGLVAIALHRTAQLHPNWFTHSWRNGIFHLVVACLVVLAHLVLMRQTVLFASRHWNRDWASLHYMNLPRFGYELLLYGFVRASVALVLAQSRAHSEAMRSLELEKLLSQSQLRVLQMQMEPHFLFNTLNAITSLIEQGRNREAVETLAHLNIILRKTLQRSSPEKVPFAEELEIVEGYLAIQQVRFADRLCIRIDTTPEALEGMVPCFLLQPIIENAIRHGIARLEGEGLLETSVERVGDRLSLRVRDNGPGTKGSLQAGHGIGIRNTRERLSYFYADDFDLSAAEPERGGYEVTIRIPYERRLR
jgi:sensor histidine kinase YesM